MENNDFNSVLNIVLCSFSWPARAEMRLYLSFQKSHFHYYAPLIKLGQSTSHTVRSPLLWNHKAENHHPSDIFRWGNSGDNSWLSWHLELGRLCLRDRTGVGGWESRGSEGTSFSLSLLLWRGSALSVTAAVWLALVGTDVWYTPPPPSHTHTHLPYISLYTLHGMVCLETEDNNMHGELFKEEMKYTLWGLEHAEMLKHCFGHSCVMLLIPSSDNRRETIPLIASGPGVCTLRADQRFDTKICWFLTEKTNDLQIWNIWYWNLDFNNNSYMYTFY